MKIRSNVLLGAICLLLSPLSANSMKPNGCKGPDLCSSYPTIDSCGWQFDVGLLAEQMRISDSGICTAVIETNPETVPLPTDTYTAFQTQFVLYKFDVDVGLRVGAGYYFKENDWQLTANFEWLRSQSSFNGPVDTPTIYRPTNYAYVFNSETDTTTVLFQEVAATLDVDYFLLDVVLARGSYFSGCFTFEPFAGIQSSWISYDGVKTFSNDARTGAGRLVNSRTWVQLANVDFWGVGPEVGIDTGYFLSSGWSIYSFLNAAVLFGQTTLTDINGFISAPAIPTFNNTSYTDDVLCPTIRAILGLQYDRDVYCDRQHFTLRAGFDGRYYFNQYPVVTYQPQVISNVAVAGGELAPYERPAPFVQDNNSFGMVGFILDLSWDF